MIRLATLQDMPELMRMCRSFYEYADFAGKGLTLKEQDFMGFAKTLIENDLRILYVACENGKIAGTIGGIYSPWFMNFSQGMANEQWWWVDEEYRKSTIAEELLEEFIKWGKEEMGATHIMMGVLNTNKRAVIERLYKMKGYKPLETYFVKEI